MLFEVGGSEASLVGNKLTRLGEFSPIGRWFTSGSFLKIIKSCTIFNFFFPGYLQVKYIFDKNCIGLHSWCFFSKTDQVTLFATCTSESIEAVSYYKNIYVDL
jgi:hypothetical protein